MLLIFPVEDENNRYTEDPSNYPSNASTSLGEVMIRLAFKDSLSAHTSIF